MIRKLLVLVAMCAFAVPSYAQSPNNAAILVVVVDQTGAVVPDAAITVVNTATGLTRNTTSDSVGSANVGALPLDGTYRISVSKAGFTADEVTGLVLRATEVATVKVTLVASGGESNVTVYGTESGVRATPQVSLTFDSAAIDEMPIAGRKISSLPLFNAAFRQAKGTGDLFVNATYVTSGAGSRRTMTFMLDGANNDEDWGRQIMVATVPLGAVKEMSALSNAFSAEFGWTSGPATNIVTKSGGNDLRGELLYMGRPGSWQSEAFGTKGFCPPSVSTCQTPSTLAHINPADTPDVLNQYSASIGGPIQKDRTFFFLAADYTAQNRTTFLSPSLPAFVLPADGSLDYVGHYRQKLFNGRVDHTLNAEQSVMLRLNTDHFFDTNPNDAVVGTNAPTVARRYSRGSWTLQGNHTWILSPRLLNEVRASYVHGDPVTKWESQQLSTTYRRSGSAPFTIGESRQSDIYSKQTQIQDTLTWAAGQHTIRFGGSLARHVSGGVGSEPGQATLGTFTFLTSHTAPFDQLTLADVQNYSQPIDYGVSTYDYKQWFIVGFVQDSFRVTNDLTLNLGLRYDRQTATDSTKDFAPRLGFSWHPGGDSKTVVRGGYAMYYTQFLIKQLAKALTGGLDGITSYTAAPGQPGFPTCLTGSCLPLNFDPLTLPISQRPARDITIMAGMRDFYGQQFADYGIDFSAIAASYPDALQNPRSQITTIGAEREIRPGLFLGGDYVHQHWTGLDGTVDLNAPSVFDRTAPDQTRSVAAANATRPIAPVNGGVRQVNVLMNYGVADYDGLQTQLSYRGNPRFMAALNYTLSKATNTMEPDGNGISPNQTNLARLGEDERGPSVLDQRHRAVITFVYNAPRDITFGTVTSLASARPFNSTTGTDDNGDGSNNDRPVIDGAVIGKSSFRGTGTQDVSLFTEGRIRLGKQQLLLRLEGLNVFNHANILGRAVTVYGNGETASPTFGQVVAVGSASNALPSLSNIDPSRTFQLQVRYLF